MNIEENIFSKLKINYKKLIQYGFTKNNNIYSFSQNIMNNTLKAQIFITSDGSISGKIYDIEFCDEYINFRMEDSIGEFVGKVRQEYEDILKNIASTCCEKQYFIYEQFNRITKRIIKKYSDIPEFPWEKSPEGGIFRNPENGKWYGLIMNVSKKVFGLDDIDVEILNVKLPEDTILELLKKNGFYKAYHMNKKNWLSIILDNALPDDEIMNYIEISHKYTEKSNEWLIPANPKYYDITNCFNDKDIINWKQSSNIKVRRYYLFICC